MSNTIKTNNNYFEEQNIYPRVHHSNKAIRFGDHSPGNLISCGGGGLRNRAPKDERKRKSRVKERERNPHSQKRKEINKHETLCQALELCVTN